MPQPYPKEFRDDVIRVALNRDEKTTIGEIAKDFGVHEGTIAKWLRQADTEKAHYIVGRAGPPLISRHFGGVSE